MDTRDIVLSLYHGFICEPWFYLMQVLRKDTYYGFIFEPWFYLWTMVLSWNDGFIFEPWFYLAVCL